ncbi:MAG: hypothetical protein J6A92_05150 [Lachnospiraceae bacterium]|nr:hypothetical protein [Lachnospiraceae bacterium]
MKKNIVYMTEWQVYVYGGEYNLSGTADEHPVLGKHVYVAYTSSLETFELRDDILTYETKNTIYKCPLKYIDINPYRTVVEEYKKQLAHQADTSDSCLDRIIAAAAKIAIGIGEEDTFVKHILELASVGRKELEEQIVAENNRLKEIVKQYENSVYLEVSNIACGDKMAYHLGSALGTVKPRLHSGMFQDSVLYMKIATEKDACALDFRYFPKGLNFMETYSWSDNIQYAVIKNVRNETIFFNGTKIEPEETRVCTPDTHRQELVSSDCYNGKSILSVKFCEEK